MEELKKETGITTSTISHNLSNMEKKSITSKIGEKYILSPIGNIITCNLIENIKTAGVINKFQKFWLKHDLSSIPPEYIKKMGDLYNSSLVESESGAIYKPHETYSQLLLKSKYIKGVSPILSSKFLELFQNMIMKKDDITVELLLTQDVINQIIEGIDFKKLKYLNDSMSEGKLKLGVLDDDVKIGLTITDKYLSLGLFHEYGDYDHTKDLISDDRDAVAWGNNLFKYYQGRSEEFKL
jgi:predicted transcriptional regulator